MSDDSMQAPLVFYERGKSLLLSGELYESLSAYCKGLQTSSKVQYVELAFDTIDDYAVFGQLNGYDLVQKLLLVGLAVKFPTTEAGVSAMEQIKKHASTCCQSLEEPIVIVAGGCSSEVESKMRTYRGLVLDVFRGFVGSIISGGTASGISGLIGEVQSENLKTVRVVGYVPKAKKGLADRRYGEIRFTDGDDFSPLEPLQYWIDIVASCVEVPRIKLLGLNGGRISAFEFRLALSLGAQVAIVRDSGLEAEKILLDKDWNSLRNFVALPNDFRAIRLFLNA
jgi:hypothetical protein